MDSKVSVASGDFGHVQSVCAWRSGWLYQGEAVISDRWSTEFSAPLTGSSSFQVVILTSADAIDAASLQDRRIGVWIPSERVEHPDVNRAAAAQGIREQSATYRTARSSQMDDLTSALDRRSATDDERFAANLRFALADAQVVTSGVSVELDSSAVFESDVPLDWITATGAALLNANYASLTTAVFDRITEEDVREKVAPWITAPSESSVMSPEAVAIGLRPDGQPVEDLIFRIYEGDSLSGDEAHKFLVHELGYPNYIAAAHLLAAVANSGAEIVWQDASPDSADEFASEVTFLQPPLNRFNVDEFNIALLEFGNIKEVVAQSGSNWDSALPFIRTVMPDAMPERHTPEAVQAAEFDTELQRLSTRAMMADALVTRLAQSLEVPSPVVGLERLGLLDVLSASDWRQFLELASGKFGTASDLRNLVETYGRFRSLSINTSEIEQAWRYLSLVDDAEESGFPQLSIRTLMTRFDLHDLIASPDMWPVLLGEFTRWKSGRTEEYRQAHEETRSDTVRVTQLIERGMVLAEATNRLRTLKDLPSQGAVEALDSWEVVSEAAQACSLGMNEVDLDSLPYCVECNADFSEPNGAQQVDASIRALEIVLNRINAHISAAAVNEILDDEESPEMLKLQTSTLMGLPSSPEPPNLWRSIWLSARTPDRLEVRRLFVTPAAAEISGNLWALIFSEHSIYRSDLAR